VDVEDLAGKAGSPFFGLLFTRNSDVSVGKHTVSRPYISAPICNLVELSSQIYLS
jgi:hypothetical protein